jgi:FMN phosphatase YigB (HAD superfamily)
VQFFKFLRQFYLPSCVYGKIINLTLYFTEYFYRMKKTIQERILNIIFDLGGVLVDLDFMSLVKHFKRLGAAFDFSDYRKVISDPVFQSFELGLTSPAGFRNRIREILGVGPVTDDEIDKAWCSLLGSVPSEKVNLLKQLASRYNLFLFSNTNDIHIRYFKCRFESEHGFSFEPLFEKTFYSHDIHDRKPLISSYEKVARLAGIVPEETLFVDDFEENIGNAKKFGLQVLHYHPGTDLENALKTKIEELNLHG